MSVKNLSRYSNVKKIGCLSALLLIFLCSSLVSTFMVEDKDLTPIDDGNQTNLNPSVLPNMDYMYPELNPREILNSSIYPIENPEITTILSADLDQNGVENLVVVGDYDNWIDSCRAGFAAFYEVNVTNLTYVGSYNESIDSKFNDVAVAENLFMNGTNYIVLGGINDGSTPGFYIVVLKAYMNSSGNFTIEKIASVTGTMSSILTGGEIVSLVISDYDNDKVQEILYTGYSYNDTSNLYQGFYGCFNLTFSSGFPNWQEEFFYYLPVTYESEYFIPTKIDVFENYANKTIFISGYTQDWYSDDCFASIYFEQYYFGKPILNSTFTIELPVTDQLTKVVDFQQIDIYNDFSNTIVFLIYREDNAADPDHMDSSRLVTGQLTYPSSFSILPGNEKGIPSTPWELMAGVRAESLYIGDLNRDGIKNREFVVSGQIHATADETTYDDYDYFTVFEFSKKRTTDPMLFTKVFESTNRIGSTINDVTMCYLNGTATGVIFHVGQYLNVGSGQAEILVVGLLYPHVNEGINWVNQRFNGIYDNPYNPNGSVIESFDFGDVDFDGQIELVSIGTTNITWWGDGFARMEVIIWEIDDNTGNLIPNITWNFIDYSLPTTARAKKSIGSDLVIFDADKDGKDEIYALGRCWSNSTTGWQGLLLLLDYKVSVKNLVIRSPSQYKFQPNIGRNAFPTCIDVYRTNPANNSWLAVGGVVDTFTLNQQQGFWQIIKHSSYPNSRFTTISNFILGYPVNSSINDLKVGDIDSDGVEEVVTVGDIQLSSSFQSRWAHQIVWNRTSTTNFESELLWKNNFSFRINIGFLTNMDPMISNFDATFSGVDFNDWDGDGKDEIITSGFNGNLNPLRVGDGIVICSNSSYNGVLRLEFFHYLSKNFSYNYRKDVQIDINEIDFDNASEFCSIAALITPNSAFEPLLSVFNSSVAVNVTDLTEFNPSVMGPRHWRSRVAKIGICDLDMDGIKDIFMGITEYNDFNSKYIASIKGYQKAVRHDYSRPDIVKLNSTNLITDNSIDISFNVSDPAFNLDEFWIQINYGQIMDRTQASRIEYFGNIQRVTYSITSAMLNLGDNLIEIFANDTLGNLNDSEYYTLYLDQLPPIVQINYPTDGIYITGDFNFEVEISDGGQVDTMWYQIGDVNRTFTENGTISLSELDLIDEGPFELKFYANDSVGHLNWNSRTLYKETQVPIVEIYSPIDGVYLNHAPYMEAYIYDANIDKMWFEFDSNGTFFDFSNSTMNSDIWNSLSEGGHMLTVYGNDSVNNLNYCNIIFIKDTLIPTIEIISPGNLTQSNSPPVIHVVVYDADCCAEISFSLNESDPISISNDTDFYMEYYMWDAYLDQEWAEIKFTVIDSAGNVNNTVIVLVQKSSSISIPNIIIHEPSSDNQWFSNSPNFYVEFIDPILDKTYFIIDSNGTKFEYYDNMPFSESRWNFLTEGLHLFQFFANNTAGGLNWSEIYIGKDTIVPNVNVESPDNNHKFVNVFDYSLSITELHLNDIWYTIDIEAGEKTYLSGPSGMIDLSGLSDGIHQIYFWVSDLANNQQYRMINIIQDTIGPSFIGESNLPFDAVLNQTFWFNFRVNEMANAYYEIQFMPGTRNWLSPDGQFGDPDTEFNYKFNGTLWEQLDDGVYTIILLILDELGNGDAQYITITKDTIIPTLNEFALFWNGFKIIDIGQTITVTNRPVFIIDDPESDPTVWRAFLVILRNQGPTGSWGSDYIVIEMIKNSEGNFEARVPEAEWPKKSQSFRVIISVMDFAGNENHWEINLYISVAQKVDPILFIVIGAVGSVAAVGIVMGVRKKSSKRPVEIPAPVQGALKETEAKNQPSNGKGKTLPPIDLKHYEGIEGVSKNKSIPLPNTAPNNIQGKLPMQGKIPGAKLPGKGKGAGAESENESKYIMSAQELADLKKTEQEVAVAKEKKICVVHKGPIGGSIYMCPECETFYCQKCAVSLKRAGDKCWTCGHEIDIYVPAEIETPVKSENGNTNGNINGINNGNHAEKTESIVQTELSTNKIAEEKPATEVVSTVEKMVQENNVLSEDIKTKLRNGILPEESNDEAFKSLVKQISTLITPEELEMLNLVTLNLNDVDKRKFLEDYLSLNASERLNLIKKMNSQQNTAEDE